MDFPGPISLPKSPQLELWLNLMRKAAISSQIQASPHVKVSRGLNSTILRIKPSVSEGGTATAAETGPCPFDMTIVADVTPPSIDLTFFPGKINEYIPSNLMDTFVLDPTTFYWVKINCTTDGKAITGATIVIDTNPSAILIPEADEAPSTFDYLLGVVNNGVAQKIIECGNITANPVQVFTEDKPDPTVGLSPYIRWWSWAFTIS